MLDSHLASVLFFKLVLIRFRVGTLIPNKICSDERNINGLYLLILDYTRDIHTYIGKQNTD